MSCVGRPSRLIVVRHRLAPISNHQAVDQPPELLQARFGLIKGRLMARLVQAQLVLGFGVSKSSTEAPSTGCRTIGTYKAKVSILSNLSVLLAVHNERRIVACAELCCSLVLQFQRHGLASKPVADVVGVAIHHCRGHATVDDALQVLLEVCKDKVARALKAATHRAAGRACVVDIDAQSVLRRSLVEEIDEKVWRRWVVLGVSDVWGKETEILSNR